MENDLIRRAQAGDHEAFRQLVETYAGLTERTARVLLPDRASAEDAVQEAWLDAWRGLPGFQAGRPFRPWLLAIVANRCRMLARRKQLPVTPLDEVLAEQWPDSADLAAGAIRAEGQAEVRAALATLQPDQRRMLALRYFAGLELREIAELTATPLGTVKSRLHRALDSLRDQLQPQSAANHRKE